MPFKSSKQAKFLFKTKPKLAKKWAGKYGMPKGLNETIRSGGKMKGMSM